MRKIVLYHFALLALGVPFLMYTKTAWCSVSFMAGVGFTLLNLASHLFVWRGGLSKKLIALSATVIVFKYAIFAAIIFWILGLENISPTWFCIGVGSLIFTSIFVAIGKEEYVI